MFIIVYGGDREEQRHVRTPGLPDWAGDMAQSGNPGGRVSSRSARGELYSQIDDITPKPIPSLVILKALISVLIIRNT